MTPAVLETNILVSLIYGISIYSAVWALAFLLIKNTSVAHSLTPASNRYGSIDGLRGVLAIGVMVHHSSAAYGYFSTGDWGYGTNPLLNHLGSSGVALFFMITAFLFTNKALQGEISWASFFKMRLKRLFPLYFIVVTVTFTIVLIISNFELHVSLWKYSIDYIQWLSFVVFGRPEINSMKDSALLIAGVNWSLKYEVLFYIVAVPTIFYTAKILSRLQLISACVIFSTALVAVESLWSIEFKHYIFNFIGGMLIAILCKIDNAKMVFEHKYYHIFGFISLVILSVTASEALSLMLLFVIFSSIVGGGSLFGLLKTRASIWLGDISYGVYLLHGLVLYALLALLQTGKLIHVIDIWIYWAMIITAAAIVVVLASISYVFMEKPIMNSGKKLIPQQGAAPEPAALAR